MTDVANAIFDRTDGIMLSAETAVGENPVEAVRTMRYIAQSRPTGGTTAPVYNLGYGVTIGS